MTAESTTEEPFIAPFIAFLLDETSDGCDVAQLSLVFHFATDSGMKERFTKYEDVPGNKQSRTWRPWPWRPWRNMEYGHNVEAWTDLQPRDGAAVTASGAAWCPSQGEGEDPTSAFHTRLRTCPSFGLISRCSEN